MANSSQSDQVRQRMRSILERSPFQRVDDLNQYIHSEAFMKECRVQAWRHASRLGGCPGPAPPYQRSEIKLYEKGDGRAARSSHAVPKLEAHLYYFGLCGRKHRGPKLIYRTSKDVFIPPSGPEKDIRLMQLLLVSHHDKLSQGNLCVTIRDEMVNLLDKRGIRRTSVDLVRFRWEEQKADGGTETVTTRVTIWIEVRPGTLTGDVAFESSQDILQILEKHDIHDIEVAYRESVTRPLIVHEWSA